MTGEAPLHIAVDLPDGAGQSLWAHGGCLGSRLHSSVPFLTPDEYPVDQG